MSNIKKVTDKVNESVNQIKNTIAKPGAQDLTNFYSALSD